MIKIDIGCGATRHKDCNIGLDKADFSEHYEPGGFIHHDILERLPFDDDSVDWIYCHHVLEHLPQRIIVKKMVPIYEYLIEGMPETWKGREVEKDIDAMIFVMNEFARVLKPGCDAFIVVPWIEHTNAWRHPTHYRFFDENYFAWFSHMNPSPDLEAEGMVRKFEVVRNEIVDGCHVLAILRKMP